MDESGNHDTITSILYRDKAASVLFGIALFLILLISLAGAQFAASRHAGLLMVALVLTGAFAVVGAVFGFVRSLRSRSVMKRRSV